ncbi:type II toxin-antitoxin system HipA family toxin (plasmid) [Mesorhizobium huakuii]|uniref:Type II toxin-antitoxin system HipA family toxin n=2 Tax=Mesorhizobium huakuii TaxID=28104 RepID=A0A7G6T6G0_9HYPH|nr:type II toxin-antitoxin system HipA family toxin [Mesorhizobium huakuii]QND69565.1 type II toxin-antitoxin system HipA family toxin [Mesorhizobium loti]
MKFRPIREMKVVLDLEGSQRQLGTLAWSTDERRAYFQYSAEFITAPLLISPFNLAAKAGLIAAKLDPFDGLHGLFNDSLPDGWGRLLLDRRLQKAGVDYHMLTPLDRLSAVGRTGMGALAYIPELPGEEPAAGDLDWFVEQVELVQNEMDTADIDALQSAQGGSAGARPKIMIGLNPDQNTFVIDYGHELKPGFDRWMVKSRSSDDPADIGVEEQAYALMAREAGLAMAETRILQTKKGNRLFATKRFDRTPEGRLHMHTASGLLYASHREASLDYAALHKLTHMMTRDSAEVLRMFGHMAFNVHARNRDDHSKNHAFLMGPNGRWKLSPAYDLTFSAGPGGQHSASIAGEGLNPGRQHLLAVAKGASISEQEALNVIERIRSAVDRWPRFADEAGLSKARTNELDLILNGRRPQPAQALRWDTSPDSLAVSEPLPKSNPEAALAILDRAPDIAPDSGDELEEGSSASSKM